VTPISFDPHASSIRVAAALEGTNRWLMSMVLDTGASRTVLTPGSVHRIKAPQTPHSPPMHILTASGVVAATYSAPPARAA